jgi:hypothetical protein
VLFYEYFHGDTGQRLGASHQTGWTGLVAFTADFFERIKSDDLLEKLRTRNTVRIETKPAAAKPAHAGAR